MLYSLKRRLIAFFVVLLLVSFGTMAVLFFNESRSIIATYIESSAYEKMEEYGSFVNMGLMQMYDLCSVVFNSDTTKAWDNAWSDPGLSAGEKTLANIQLSQFLTRTTNSYSIVSSVAIYRQEGLWIAADNPGMPDTAFKQAAWYNSFYQQGERFVPAHQDPAEVRRAKPFDVVSLLLPIGTFEPSQAKSMMKVNVRADFFLEPLNRIHLGETGTIFLLDQQGRSILNQHEYASHPEAAQQVEQILAQSGQQGVTHIGNAQGSKDILVYKKLKQSGWLLVGLVPEADLYGKLYKLRTTMLVLGSLLLVGAIAAATWLSYGISGPLSRLASAMRYVQMGDFDGAESRIPAEGKVRNEVGYVTATFRNMVSRLRQHIQTEFELKLLRQQAEYKALLMQINPHFLFNTLELLSSLAMQRRTHETVSVIESLGKMMRFSLRSSDDLIRLEEELTYVRHYVAILQIRFGDKLYIRLEEEEKTGRLSIPKFILQPLIENAVKYSFRQQAEARIGIRAWSLPDGLHLSVSDNGPGIEPELAQRLQAEARSSQFPQILDSRSQQIGLRNVLARCQLYYGALFAFHIQSVPGQGTCIELILPAQGGVNDV
ncbi:two-component system, sensor histidine kinase YesM [Paenibacillus sp. UNCCL117]|uniref:sensor histidine kinase n=1 Tax=unclassified Paenibacillus TaxID=185978 RepID=UPI0008899D14|nr:MULTISPECIES: sensor histidine kinase [unclassified Paenibacillus]SDD58342.1 two-component system, sensor histidine kinase YesM [Paenibacillus sp. cl123]SFW51036.1 two-component system, sensor histidine kinase YesM [Paenibacillus sp. UNCCL117]